MKGLPQIIKTMEPAASLRSNTPHVTLILNKGSQGASPGRRDGRKYSGSSSADNNHIVFPGGNFLFWPYYKIHDFKV
jgi:hypothetical protein